MSKIDLKYHELLNEILEDGYMYNDPNRKGVKRIQINDYKFVHNFCEGFPALTTKKLAWKSVVGELIWILRGDDNIKYLVDNNIPIWDLDAYNHYLQQCKKGGNEPSLSFYEFISAVKDSAPSDERSYKLGDVDRSYGPQLREWTGRSYASCNGYDVDTATIDQLDVLLNTLKTNPMATKKTVTFWNPAELEATALTPCFTEEVLINTSKGYKKIIDVQKEDLVLTKEGDYKEVYDKMITPYEGTLIGLNIKGRTDVIKCTPNHEFFIKDKGWIQSLFVEEGDFVGTPINNKKEIPIHLWNIKQNQFTSIAKSKKLDNKDLWWLMGYFVGDGWVSKNTNTINLAISDKEYEIVYDKIKDVIPNLNKGQSSGKSARYYFSSVEFATLFRKFGHKAKNKFIPEFILNAPKDYLIEFVEGYKMADGTKTKDIYQFGTISESLAYGIQIVLSKLSIPCSVNKTKKDKYTIIEGRKVKQHEFYYIIESYKKESLDVIIDENIIWYKIKNKYLFKDVKTDVYNISVRESHTYTAYNIINHNCHWGFEVLVNPLFTFDKCVIRTPTTTNKDIGSHAHHTINKWLDENNIPKHEFELKFHMHSVDTFLGLPFNTAFYGLLTQIVGKMVNMKPKGIIPDLSNVHIYEPHLDAVHTQLGRSVMEHSECQLEFSDEFEVLVKGYRDNTLTLDEFIGGLKIEMFTLKDYASYPRIKADMLPYSK